MLNDNCLRKTGVICLLLAVMLMIVGTAPVVLGKSDIGPYYSFESHNYPGEFIRHANNLGEKTSISSRLDKLDSTFALRPGLADNRNYVSFESYNYLGRFLRHQDYRIKLNEETSDQLFKEDATFKIVHGLADSHAVSFQSYNYPDLYIRHKDGHLYVNKNDGSKLFKEDATFYITEPNAR
jgi:hypothetical protein